MLRASGRWAEVGERVYQRRYQPWDVSVVAVVGEDGVLLADTRGGLAQAAELRADLRRLTRLPVRWVVNTHAHFDHAWGNAEFVAPRQVPPAQLWAHRAAAAELASPAPEVAAEAGPLPPDFRLAVPDRLVEDSGHVLDLGGGRVVELRWAGRGHTGGDLWLRVPDADVLLAGDLVEESGPPALGADSYPLDWAPTLSRVLDDASLLGPDTVVVPGHGAPVGRDFVAAQRDSLAELASAIRAAFAEGRPAAKGLPPLAPWGDPALLAQAYARGVSQLRAAPR